MRVAVLKTAAGTKIPLSEADRLWLARMVVGEEGTTGGDLYLRALTVASSMLRRLAFTAATAPWGPSLTNLLLGSPTGAYAGYSEPIRYASRSTGTPQQQARRAEIRALRWAAIPEPIRRAVDDLFSGRIALAQPGSGIIHFASVATVAARLGQEGPRREGWRVEQTPAYNAMVSTAAARGKQDPVIEPVSTSVGRYVFLGVAATVAAAGAFVVVRSTKRG